MAASYFNRMAAEQKLDMRAMARGTTPDAAVPAWAVDKLKADGFDVSSFKPQALASADVSRAVTIVAFWDIPKELAEPKKTTSWMDVPPASTDYEKSKAAMLAKIAALVTELKAR
jgi:protein-tyrosine-phosphatase